EKLSQLAAAGSVSTADLFYVVQGGTSKSATGTLLATLAPVQSVAGRAGTVTLSTSDITGLGSIATHPTSDFISATASRSGNFVLAGPTSGSAAAPSFRALVAGDVPAIPESGVTNLVSDLAAKAPLASPTFTGSVVIPGGAIDGTAIGATTPVQIQGYR